MLTFPHTTAPATATARILRTWLISNLGGTGWLVLDFCRDSPSDIAIPLVIGLMAALISLASVPLAIPFFALAQRLCTGWKCRIMALLGVMLVFALGNFMLLELLPIGPVSSLLSVSRPYLGAAVLAVMWLYRPQPARRVAAPALMSYHRYSQPGAIRWSELAQ
jgi:hypothetical protein